MEQARKTDLALREGVLMSAKWLLLALRLPMQPALKEIEESLAELPLGAPKQRLDQLRDTVIERHRAKRELIASAVSEIHGYLAKLRERYEFGPDEDPLVLEWRLKPTVREALDKQLSGREAPEDVAKRARRLIREALHIE